MKLCPHRQRLMYFFPFSFRAVAFRCRSKRCLVLWLWEKMFRYLQYRLSPLPLSCPGPWNATPVLSSHSSWYTRTINWSRDLTWFKNQSEHNPQLSFFFPGPVTLKVDHFPKPQLLETLARESDRNLLSTKTIRFAEKLLSSSLPRGDLLINGSLFGLNSL